MRRIALLALLAHILVGASSAGIWCFRSDGHVAFERIDDQHPLVNDGAEIALRLLGAALRGDDGRSAHGPCFDVALAPGSQRYAASRSDGPCALAPAVPSAVAAEILALPRLASAARDGLARGDAAGDRALTPIRTSVLRI